MTMTTIPILIPLGAPRSPTMIHHGFPCRISSAMEKNYVITLLLLLVLLLNPAVMSVGGACTDDDAKIAELAASQGRDDISGCADVGGMCGANTQAGTVVRQWCCATCEAQQSGPATSLPPPADDDPVHLFLLGGQSECVGQASAALLETEGKFDYPSLVGEQEGVWLAGISQTDQFFVAPMSPLTKFGPEVSFGQRVHQVAGARVLVVKYCWGGSSVAQHWNPTTVANRWDYATDNGTAAWLVENAGVDFTDKNALFVNQVYTVRRTTEALVAAGVTYVWKGIVWVQGQADHKKNHWTTFGTDTARVFDAMREISVGVWNLPIVDTGSGGSANGRTGKAFAGQLVKGCRVTTIENGSFTANPNSTCVPGPSNACPGSTFISVDFFNHFGWDVNLPDSLKPVGANDKTFRWYKQYPTNLHSEYGGMILKGRMLADEYVRAFTTIPLPEAFATEDPALLFPWFRCSPRGTKPSMDNLCWVDLRDEAQAEKECVASPPPCGTQMCNSTSNGTPQLSSRWYLTGLLFTIGSLSWL